MRIAERRSLAGDDVLGGEEGDWLEGRWLLLLCDRRGWPGRALARSTGLRCGPLALLLLLLRRWRIVRLLLPDRPVHLLNALRIGVGRPGGRRSRRAIRRRPGKLLLLLLLLRIYRGRWLLVVGLGLSLAKGWSRMLLLLLLRSCVCSSRQRERRPGRGSARVSERRSGKGSTEGQPATHSPETLRQGPGKILQLQTLLLLVHSKGSNGTRGLLVRGASSEGRQGRPSPGRARRRRVARIDPMSSLVPSHDPPRSPSCRRDDRLIKLNLPATSAGECAWSACFSAPGDRPRPGVDLALGRDKLGPPAAAYRREATSRRVGVRHAVGKRAYPAAHSHWTFALTLGVVPASHLRREQKDRPAVGTTLYRASSPTDLALPISLRLGASAEVRL